MSFFPPDYRSTATNTSSDEKSPQELRYFKPTKLQDQESTVLRPCGTFDTGHVITGWEYFTDAGQPRRFPKYPEGYLSDIGLSWEGKNKGTGEKARPIYFLSFACLWKKTNDFAVATFTQKQLREQLERVLAMEDYQFLDSGIANFTATITRSGTGTDTSYVLTPTLKPPTKDEVQRWSDFSSSVWLPAMYVNADPWAGRPNGSAAPVGLPPSHRDPMGADIEVATTAAPTSGWD